MSKKLFWGRYQEGDINKIKEFLKPYEGRRIYLLIDPIDPDFTELDPKEEASD